MLTEEQKKWIEHLSNDDEIKIVPFDPTAEDKFNKVKNKIQAKLGKTIIVEHHGASSLKISGQDEIDIYVPVQADRFSDTISKLKKVFGEPRSNYPLKRARFATSIKGKHIDVFLINSESDGYTSMIKFEGYLRSHPNALKEYKELKENNAGLSTREYYHRKTEFINEILAK